MKPDRPIAAAAITKYFSFTNTHIHVCSSDMNKKKIVIGFCNQCLHENMICIIYVNKNHNVVQLAHADQ